MAIFNQGNQTVATQYNVGGDLNQDNRVMKKADKIELEELLAQLNRALNAASPAQQQQAQQVAELVEGLLEQAAADKPKKSMMTVTAKGLLDAAKGVAAMMPIVAQLVPQIVKLLV